MPKMDPQYKKNATSTGEKSHSQIRSTMQPIVKTGEEPNSHASLNHFKNEKHLLEHLRDHELHKSLEYLSEQCPPKYVFNTSDPVQDTLQVINSGLEQLEKNITQSHHILSKDEYVQQKIQVTQLLESIIEKLDKHNSISEE